MGWIVHVDMDAYFASVEQLKNPALRGKPVVVGGLPGTRSTVSTASYEARRFGIRSGMAIAEAYRRCPQAVFLPGSSALYLHTSARIFELLRGFSPRLEPASVDEAYLEVESDDPRALGACIQERIEEDIGLTASLGISESKVLAKVGSSFKKPRGLTVLRRADVEEVLWPLPASVLPGVGEKTAARLALHGYRTVGDLGRASEAELVRRFGAHGASLRRRARGEDRGRVTPPEEAPDAKSIGHEHTLERDVYERSQLEALLCVLVQKVGRRARKHGLAGRRLLLKLRDRRFHTISHGRVLPRAVDADEDLFRIGCELLGETRFWERGVRLLGVSLQLLVPARQLELDLGPLRATRALPVVDALRSKYGARAVVLGRGLEAAEGRGPHDPRISFTLPR